MSKGIKRLYNSKLFISILTIFLTILGLYITSFIGVIQIDIGKKNNDIAQEGLSIFKENSIQNIKYKLKTKENDLFFIDGEKKEITFDLTNLGDNLIISENMNYNGEIYSEVHITGGFEKIINIQEIGLNQTRSMLLDLESSFLPEGEGKINIEIKCKYKNDETLKCFAEGNKLVINYTKIDNLKILGIDASMDDSNENGDNIDLIKFVDYMRDKKAKVKTMYSKIFYRNNGSFGDNKNGQIILFYNHYKYSQNHIITKHVENILFTYYGDYIEDIEKFQYTEKNFYNLLSPLSDCFSDKECWRKEVQFNNLTDKNLFSKSFFDYNRDIDFVFMLPAKVK